MKVVLTTGTVADLIRGIKWFDRIALGLGDQFEIEFYDALDRIKQSPELFAANQPGYRACRLKRFTAVLYFRIDDDCLVVVGLFTSGEDESVLKDRG
jgi:hypothetical protein